MNAIVRWSRPIPACTPISQPGHGQPMKAKCADKQQKREHRPMNTKEPRCSMYNVSQEMEKEKNRGNVKGVKNAWTHWRGWEAEGIKKTPILYQIRDRGTPGWGMERAWHYSQTWRRSGRAGAGRMRSRWRGVRWNVYSFFYLTGPFPTFPREHGLWTRQSSYRAAKHPPQPPRWTLRWTTGGGWGGVKGQPGDRGLTSPPRGLETAWRCSFIMQCGSKQRMLSGALLLWVWASWHHVGQDAQPLTHSNRDEYISTANVNIYAYTCTMWGIRIYIVHSNYCMISIPWHMTNRFHNYTHNRWQTQVPHLQFHFLPVGGGEERYPNGTNLGAYFSWYSFCTVGRDPKWCLT